MKLNQLHLIEEGIERIAAVTDTDVTEIIEALTGVAWDDEDAGKIRGFMIGASADENERLRQDAERYRWLRDANINTLPYDDHGIGPEFPCGDDLDAAIDAAMSKEGK